MAGMILSNSSRIQVQLISKKHALLIKLIMDIGIIPIKARKLAHAVLLVPIVCVPR